MELQGNLRAFIEGRVRQQADVDDLVHRVIDHNCFDGYVTKHVTAHAEFIN